MRSLPHGPHFPDACQCNGCTRGLFIQCKCSIKRLLHRRQPLFFNAHKLKVALGDILGASATHDLLCTAQNCRPVYRRFPTRRRTRML